MKKLILLLLTSATFLQAQITPFQKKFGGLEREILWRTDKISDDKFVSGGSLISGDRRDGLITVFDIEGNLDNAWILGDDSFDYTNISDVLALEDGSMVVIGHVRPYANDDEHDNAFIYRISPEGTVLWSKQFGNEQIQVIAQDGLIETSDGNILWTGLVSPQDSNDQALLIKMAVNGSVLFSKQWNASTDYERFGGVTEVSDGYVVAGYSDFFEPDLTTFKPIVVKFDFNGNMLWSNIYDDGSLVHANNIRILANDDELFVAYGAGNQDSNAGIDRDIIVMKLSSSGGVIWANRYIGPAGEDIDDMSFSHSGNIIINGDLTGIGFEEANGFVAIISVEGDLHNVHLFGKDKFDSITDIIKIEENDCRGYLLFGHSRSFNLDESDDGWIIKTDVNFGDFADCFTQNVPFSVQSSSMQSSSLGTVTNWNVTSTPSLELTEINFSSSEITSCAPIIAPDCTTVATDDLHLEKPNIHLFPNPNEGHFKIQIDNVQNIKNVNLFDTIGRPVPFDYTSNGNTIEMKITNEFYGIAFIHFYINNTSVSEVVIIGRD